MIDLYMWPTGNGKKITIMLEECELPYRAIPIHIGKGDQFTPEFTRLNPNQKMPVIVDHSGAEPLVIFESGAILQYLAEKNGRFRRRIPPANTACCSGCTGRSAASAPWLARRIISCATPRNRFHTPWNASATK